MNLLVRCRFSSLSFLLASILFASTPFFGSWAQTLTPTPTDTWTPTPLELPSELSVLQCQSDFEPVSFVPTNWAVRCTIALKDALGNPLVGAALSTMAVTSSGGEAIGPFYAIGSASVPLVGTAPSATIGFNVTANGTAVGGTFYVSVTVGLAFGTAVQNISGSPQALIVVGPPSPTQSMVNCTSVFTPWNVLPTSSARPILTNVSCTITALAANKSAMRTSAAYFQVSITPSSGVTTYGSLTALKSVGTGSASVFSFSYVVSSSSAITTTTAFTMSVLSNATSLAGSPVQFYLTAAPTTFSQLSCTSGLNPVNVVPINQTLNCSLAGLTSSRQAMISSLADFDLSVSAGRINTSSISTSDGGFSYNFVYWAPAMVTSASISARLKATNLASASGSPFILYVVDTIQVANVTLACASTELPTTNVPPNGVATCTITLASPLHTFASAFNVTRSGGVGVLSSLQTTDSGQTFTFTLTASNNVTGQTDITVQVGGVHVVGSPFTLYATIIPSSASTVVCSSGNIPTTNMRPTYGTSQCNITARNGTSTTGPAIRAVASDFTLYLSLSSIGTFGPLTTYDGGFTFTTTFYAGDTGNLTSTVLVYARGVLSRGSAQFFYITYAPDESSLLQCSSYETPPTNLKRGRQVQCTISATVRKVVGTSVVVVPVYAIAADFTYVVSDTTMGSIGTTTNFDGGRTFYFTMTVTSNRAKMGALAVYARLASDGVTSIQGSPVVVYVVDDATTNSSISCDSGYTPSTNLPPSRTALCTIYPRNSGNTSIRSVASEFTLTNIYNTTVNITSLKTSDGGYTFTFNAVYLRAGQISIAATVPYSIFNATKVPISLSPANMIALSTPTTSSTLTCVSNHIPSLSLRANQNPYDTMLCTIVVRDKVGFNRAASVQFTVSVSGSGTIGPLSTSDGGATFQFVYTATAAVATAANVSAFVNVIDPIVGTPQRTTITVFL